MMKLTLLILSLGATAACQAVEITGLSIPVDSMDGACAPRDTGIWSVTGNPIPAQTGISWLIDPTPPAAYVFAMHDHVYVSDYTPDPTRSVVTFTFSEAVRVKGLRIVEHTNGITGIEGFAGNNVNALTSNGNVFGTKGDVTGNLQFAEFENNDFTFTGNATGTVFQYVITKTSRIDGYATYRTYLDYQAVPEPASMLALAAGLAVVLRRRKKS